MRIGLFWRHFKRPGLWLTLLACLSSAYAAPIDGAYRLKAAFIYRFAIFVEWPGRVFKDNSSALDLCIIGANPFGPALDSIAGKRIQQRPLNIHIIRRANAVKHCHILFISASEQANLARLLEQAHAGHVLTVSDMERFSRQGGIIQFVMQGEKLTFEINRDSAEQAGLLLSSNLLRLAAKIYAAERP